MEFDTDILICGGGPAGLSAACALGAEGHRVTLLDPQAPITGEDAPGADLRTTALLQPARDLLDRAGAWDGLAPHGTELRIMRITDASRTPPVSRDFVAGDLGHHEFGWNFPNWLLRRELLTRAEALDTVTLRFGTGFHSLFAREAGIRVTDTEGTQHVARLLIGCDGRDSPVRTASGIHAKTIDYDQTAIVFAVAHPSPHDGISTEIHAAGGPFTLVPLPDRDGQHRSAVVWMDHAAEQTRRMALGDAAFLTEAQARSADAMGTLSLISARAAWPIISRAALRLTARRTALAAEAAHAMPPIGAQGLNTSLKDIAALRDLAEKHELGCTAMLDAYARRRQPDILVRMAGIDALNRTSIAGQAPVQRLRALGVSALHDIPPLRKLVMRLGLGT